MTVSKRGRNAINADSGLTDRQERILAFIEDFKEREGKSPTVYEIATQFQLTTTAVMVHIRALVRRKKLVEEGALGESPLSLTHNSFMLPIPILGRINAGVPVESLEDKIGEIMFDVSDYSQKQLGKLFALEVTGESMRDVGILDGDVLIVMSGLPVRSGDVVAALVDGETTVKSYFLSAANKQVELRPANPEFESRFYKSEEVKIQGRIVSLMRKY